MLDITTEPGFEGKPVPKGWVVHHKNEVKGDNRPENLEAMDWGEHTKLHNDLRKQEPIDAKERIRELEQTIKDLRKEKNHANG